MFTYFQSTINQVINPAINPAINSNPNSQEQLQNLVQIGNMAIQLFNQQKYGFSKYILRYVCNELLELKTKTKIDIDKYMEHYLKIAEQAKTKIDQILGQICQSDQLIKYVHTSMVMTDLKTKFQDIIGMQHIKQQLKEIIILPNIRPDIFQGIRTPSLGILLYGPPGNGKTMLAKAIAAQGQCKFINVQISSIVSRFMGDSEKMIKAVFKYAEIVQPSIIFIDEIDGLLKQRSESEHEATRRLKNEFLVQMEGMGINDNHRVYVIGATNRINELDNAALRRFTKRIYIGHPEPDDKCQLIKHLLKDSNIDISIQQLNSYCYSKLKNYSNSDIKALVKEACMIPLRQYDTKTIISLNQKCIRKLVIDDFIEAQKIILPSLSAKELNEYKKQQQQLQSN